MKLFKGYMLVGSLCVITSSALAVLDDAEYKKILAKYGLDKPKTTINKRPDPSSLAGDLADTPVRNSNPLPSKRELQETAQLGKKLEIQVEKVDDTKLDSIKDIVNSDKEDLKEELKDAEKGAAEEKPGFFKRLFNYVPAIMKMADTVTQFNKKAAENLSRFKITFKNVSDSLASFEDDKILVPEKDTGGNYIFDKTTKAVNWKSISNKGLSADDIQTLKQECLYIIIKEMVDGFKHLDPVVGKGIYALSYLAPNTSRQSGVVYEIATKFLPMLELLAKENLESAIKNGSKQ